jgi:hypothetical protein
MLSSFLVLFILFILAIEMNEVHRINVYEAIFMIYALGFTLEKVAAMQEHGIRGESIIAKAYTPLTGSIIIHSQSISRALGYVLSS